MAKIGYAPRIIEATPDLQRGIVGCKDGSIWDVSDGGELVIQKINLGPNKVHPVRALCVLPPEGEAKEPILVAGFENGSLTALIYNGPDLESTPVELKTDQEPPDHPCLVAPLGVDGLFVVSYLFGGSSVYKIRKLYDLVKCQNKQKDLSLGKPELHWKQEDLRWVFQTEQGPLILATSGKVYRIQEHSGERTLKEMEGFWPDGEWPGFVSDFTSAKQAENRDRFADNKEIYIATDIGVYWVKIGKSVPLRPRRLPLPGITGMGLAMAYSSCTVQGSERRERLWVSDLANNEHTFECKNRGEDGFPNWLAVGLSRQANLTVHALALAPEGTSIRVLKASHEDEVDILKINTAGEAAVIRSQEEGDFWKKLNSKCETPEQFLEYLVNPPVSDFLAIFNSAPDRLLVGLRDWIVALIGEIHRKGSGTSQYYQLVIRLLRELTRISLQPAHDASHIERAVEENIRLTRKWGLFGHTYYERTSARAALEPLNRMIQSTNPGGHRPLWQDKRLDALAYKFRIFFDRTDFQSWLSSPRAQEKTGAAWEAVPSLPADDGQRKFLVSWGAGKVGIYPEGADLSNSWVRDENGENDKVGRCRSVVKLKIAGQGFVFAAPERKIEGSDAFPTYTTNFCIIQGHSYFITKVKGRILEELLKSESVYSMLLLEECEQCIYLLAGLKGTNGKPRVALLRLGLDGPSQPSTLRHLSVELLWAEKDFIEPASPLGKSPGKNPVRRLALLGRRQDGQLSKYYIAVGARDGQVVLLRLDITNRDMESCKVEAKFLKRIDRLAAPVWALAARSVGAKPDDEGVNARVYAGTADGTVMAWSVSIRADAKIDSAPLWATQEFNHAIADIHLQSVRVNIRGEQSKTESKIALVVTQGGRVVVIDDRDAVDESMIRVMAINIEQTRLPLPGCRYGKMQLTAAPGSNGRSVGVQAFASAVLPIPEGDTDLKPFCRLIVAGEQGEVSIHDLFLPDFTEDRRQFVKMQILKAWEGLVSRHDSRNRLKDLRILDLLLAAIPKATRAVARFLLIESANAETHEIELLPSRYRHLALFRKAWTEFEDGKFLQAQPPHKHLSEALAVARREGDHELSSEIIALICRITNEWLITQLKAAEGRPASNEAQAELLEYVEIIKSLRTSIAAWQGRSDESRLWITLASNFANGHVLYLASRVAGARQSALRHLLKIRFGVLQKLLNLGRPIVTLETVRALNLGLTRACFLARAMAGGKQTGDTDLAWEDGLEGLYRSLSDLAAQTIPSRSGATDALKYELIRAFSLGVVACPGAAAKLGHWLTEAGLIDGPTEGEIITGIVDGIEVLDRLGLKVRGKADIIRNFKLVLSFDTKELANHVVKMPSADQPVPAEPSTKVFDDYRPIARLLLWLNEFADFLLGRGSGPLQDVKRVMDELENAWKGAEKSYGLSNEHSYLFSLRFWVAALGLRGTIDKKEHLLSGDVVENERCQICNGPPAGQQLLDLQRDIPKDTAASFGIATSSPISPRFILGCGELAEGLQRLIDNIETRKQWQRLFDPQASIYETLLSNLKKAAEGYSRSATAQRSIVLGVMNHGMLEGLDEHVFELGEMALSLAPNYSWDALQNPANAAVGTHKQLVRGATESLGERIFQRMEFAEGIPKNLRSLRGLIKSNSLSMNGPEKELKHEISQLFDKKPFKWPPNTSLKCGQSELDHLRIVADEIAANHARYSSPDDGGVKLQLMGLPQAGIALTSKVDHEQLERLGVVIRSLGSCPVEADPRYPASHGLGLYIAALSAAIVRWRMEFSLEGSETLRIEIYRAWKE